jgi:Hemerythrin HHE cation binding domain
MDVASSNNGLSASSRRESKSNAISLLTADHREVQGWFAEFQRSTSMIRSEELAFDICEAIRIHIDIDEEIFYPALMRATTDPYKARAALADHHGIKDLLVEIERLGPTEELFFSKVHLLCELFTRHIDAEESERGIFAEAQRCPLDLNLLGAALERCKSQHKSHWR